MSKIPSNTVKPTPQSVISIKVDDYMKNNSLATSEHGSNQDAISISDIEMNRPVEKYSKQNSNIEAQTKSSKTKFSSSFSIKVDNYTKSSSLETSEHSSNQDAISISDIELNIGKKSPQKSNADAKFDDTAGQSSLNKEMFLKDDVERWFLPDWCRWFAWLLVFFHVALCSFLTVVYGLQYGNSKFFNWIFTFALSIFQNMFVVSPIRMVLMATWFASYGRSAVQRKDWVGFTGKWARLRALAKWNDLKKQYVNLDRVSIANLAEKASILGEDVVGFVSFGGIKRAGEIVKRPWCYRFPTEEGLVRAGKLRVAVTQVRRYWLEAISWTLLAVFVTALIVLQRDWRLLRLHNRARDYFVTSFYEIQARGDVFEFLEDGLVPALFKENEAAIADRFDMLGPIRIRQTRIKPYPCPTLPNKVLKKTCKPNNFEVDDLIYYETGDFGPTWTSADNKQEKDDHKSQTTSAWQYLNVGEDFGTKLALGNSIRRSMYPYGGYVVDLGYTSDDILPVVAGLKNSLWIDNATAAVFVQFSYITPSARHVTAVTLVAEFLAEGGVNLCHQTHSYRPVYIYNIVDFIVMILQVLHLGVACLIVFDLFVQFHASRWTARGIYNVVVDLWNGLSALSVGLTVAAYSAYYYHITTGIAVTQAYRKDPGKYAAFSTPAYHNVNYFLLMSAVAFTAYMRSLKLFRGSRVVSLMMRTLSRSQNQLISVSFVVLVFIIAYGHFGVLLFGNNKFDFRHIAAAGTALFSLMAGMDVQQPEHGVSSESWWAIYFGSFMMLVIGIFLNLFAAVVGDTFHKVRHKRKMGENVHTEVLAVAWVQEQFLLFFGIPSTRFKEKYKEARASNESGESYDCYNSVTTNVTPLAQELQLMIAKHNDNKNSLTP
nr:polycystin-2-like [Ciona intestinalis]|eukprot:XP_002122327.1 polycystin-2-like [Ciona intestinalis]